MFFDKQISLVAGVSKMGVMKVDACFEELGFKRESSRKGAWA